MRVKRKKESVKYIQISIKVLIERATFAYFRGVNQYADMKTDLQYIHW